MYIITFSEAASRNNLILNFGVYGIYKTIEEVEFAISSIEYGLDAERYEEVSLRIPEPFRIFKLRGKECYYAIRVDEIQ